MAKTISKEKANDILMGSDRTEPIIQIDDYNHSISMALNYYNNLYSLSDYKEATLEYAASINLAMNRAIPEYQFRRVGAVCRLISRNCNIKIEDINRNLEKLKQIQKEYVESKKDDVIISNVIPIKQIDYLVINFLNDIDDKLIIAILNNKEYNPQEYISTFTTNQYSKHQSKEITNFIINKINYIDTVHNALKEGCEQTKEAFNLIPSTRVKSVSKALKSLLEGISNIQHKEIVVKQVRKKKELSPIIQTKDMVYISKFSNINSALPSTVINSSEVWIFDTESRDIIVLRALKDLKFTAKGITFNNVDENKSFKKKLRNIDDIYLFTNTLETPTKKSLNSTFNSIKTTQQKTSGRMNSNKIIIKVFK